MFSYDPLYKHQRLWNDPDNIISESIAGTLLMHQNLVYIDSCKAIVRQDLDKLNGKVRIIGGGAVIDGLMYAGFVGPGMLTAAVLGLHKSTLHIPTTDAILEVINHVIKSDEQKATGVLLLVHDCPEYYLNFLEAKNKAESKGISVKVIYVRDEESTKLSQKPMSSPRSPSGLLLLYKIAGAMSEEENSLDEIHDVCNGIIRNQAIFSTAVYIADSFEEQAAQILVSRGDVLSDRDKKHFSMANSSTSKVVENLITDLMSVDNCQKFTPGSKIAILLDYFGGFSDLEANVVIKELVQQLNRLQFKVRIIYTGAFHVSLELKGFHLSLLNMSNNLKYMYYLNVPTAAYAWPKTNSRQILLRLPSDKSSCTKEKTDDCKTESKNESKVVKKIITTHPKTYDNDVLLIAIDFACEALIACFMKIDMLDDPKIPPELERCGTRLAFTADLIKSEISRNKFANMSPSHIFLQVARLFDHYRKDAQAELYKLFLNSIGKAIENKSHLEASDWLEACVKAINAIDQAVKGSRFSVALNAAKINFCNAYAEDGDVDVIHALGRAVNAAQKVTAHLSLESDEIPDNLISARDYGFIELAGAHAIGVWMRGAYEGIKLYYSSRRFAKRKRSDDCEAEDAVSKTAKYSYD